jgi:hypothetical protein
MPKGSCNKEFNAYGIPTRDLPDPTARAIEGLLDQVSSLQARLKVLEGELEEVRTQSVTVVNGVVAGTVAMPEKHGAVSEAGTPWLKEASR